jgi:hypothetical protein
MKEGRGTGTREGSERTKRSWKGNCGSNFGNTREGQKRDKRGSDEGGTREGGTRRDKTKIIPGTSPISEIHVEGINSTVPVISESFERLCLSGVQGKENSWKRLGRETREEREDREEGRRGKRGKRWRRVRSGREGEGGERGVGEGG